MPRPKTSRLDRARIGRAAIELVDSGQELQVVPLAKRLGVSVSSLYHHVDGRSDIVHTMREVLSEDYQVLPLDVSEWEVAIREAVAVLWRAYSDHPRVLPLLLTVTINEPPLVTFYGVMVDALRAAGIPEGELLSTVEALDAFAIGTACDSLSPELTFDPGDRDTALGGLLTAHPSGAERNRLVFERGLDLLILGIRGRALLSP